MGRFNATGDNAMSRVLSSLAIKSMFAEETEDYPILLLTISGGGLSDSINVSSDPTQRLLETDADIFYGTLSNGVEYYFLPFQLKLPDESDESSQQMSITIDNVSRELVPAIRSASSSLSVSVVMVMSCSVDVVEATFPDFIITSVDYDEMTITGNMTLDLFDNEPFPGGSFTPSTFFALF